jgi:hypothetical protein
MDRTKIKVGRKILKKAKKERKKEGRIIKENGVTS